MLELQDLYKEVYGSDEIKEFLWMRMRIEKSRRVTQWRKNAYSIKISWYFPQIVKSVPMNEVNILKVYDEAYSTTLCSWMCNLSNTPVLKLITRRASTTNQDSYSDMEGPLNGFYWRVAIITRSKCDTTLVWDIPLLHQMWQGSLFRKWYVFMDIPSRWSL